MEETEAMTARLRPRCRRPGDGHESEAEAKETEAMAVRPRLRRPGNDC